MKFFALVMVFSCAGFNAFADGPCVPELSPRIRGALEAAAEDEYTYEIMRNDGKTIVLFGEYHRKSRESAVLGRRVIEPFEHVGVEGYDRSLYWGERLRTRAGRLWRALFKGRAAVAKRVVGHRTEVSTVDDVALNRIFSGADALETQSLLGLVLTKDFWTQRRDDFVADAQNDEDRYVRSKMVDQVLEKCQALIELRRQGVAPVAVEVPKQQVYKLEEGHRPTLAQQLHSLGFAHAAAFFPPGALFMTMLTVTDLQSPPVMWTAYVVSMYLAAQHVFGRFYAQKSWFPRVFPIKASTLGPRDRTMTRNILKLMERPEIDLLLVIVGRDHVPGLKRRLTQAGFTPEP